MLGHPGSVGPQGHSRPGVAVIIVATRTVRELGASLRCLVPSPVWPSTCRRGLLRLSEGAGRLFEFV